MPGRKTYQALGFATSQGGRLYARRNRAELQRRALRTGATAAAVTVAAAGVLAALGAAARRRSRLPTV
ncbi:unannotated protein [freshwater metagenome]|uniref:Unannotated protein n=1 Tax=freshwater metagenome TaxID=449393 RepID=A0A6J7ELU0_9ZZZZ|nr:hypothetical protein [Actinomycetota bacterium]